MSKIFAKAKVVGVLVGLVWGTSLLAQPDTNTTGAKGKTGVTATVVLTLPEMLQRVGELSVQVKGDLQHIYGLREVARKNKDVIKLNCVNDKFIQAKATANIFDTAYLHLQGVASGGEALFKSATDAASDLRRLKNEANACVGEELSAEMLTESSHPPFPDDPTHGDPFEPGVEPPGYASPYN